jgi:hypothetical protein
LYFFSNYYLKFFKIWDFIFWKIKILHNIIKDKK